MADYGPVPISRLKGERARIQEALRGGRRVLLSRHGEVVASIEPPSERHASLLLDFATKTANLGRLPVLTMTDIGRGSPSAHVRSAQTGNETLLTDHGRVIGVLTAAPHAVDRARALRRAEAIDGFIATHPEAGPKDLATFADDLDALLAQSESAVDQGAPPPLPELGARLTVGTDLETNEPLALDMAEDSGLIMLGSDSAIKTAALQAIARQATEVFPPSKLLFGLISANDSWAGQIPEVYLAGHAQTTRQAEFLTQSIALELKRRASGKSVGERIIVVVDDLGERFESGRFLSPLMPFLGQSRDLGINILVGCSLGDSSSPRCSAALFALSGGGSRTVLVEGNWDEHLAGPLGDQHRAERNRLMRWGLSTGRSFAHARLATFDSMRDDSRLDAVKARAIELMAASRDAPALVTSLAAMLPSAAGVLRADTTRAPLVSLADALDALETAESAVRETEASIRKGVSS